MSENGEIYTDGKNFTLQPALTALTNSTSDRLYTLCLCVYSIIDHMQFANNYCNTAQDVCFCVCIIPDIVCTLCTCVLHTQSAANMHIVYVLYNMHLSYNCYMCVYVTHHGCTIYTHCACYTIMCV